MSREATERLQDILVAINRCRQYRSHLDDQNDAIATMAYDAVLRNLAVIGEAVRTLPSETKALSPDTPWPSIAGLRNIVIHEYFRIDRALIIDILDNQLASLAHEVQSQLNS